MSIDTNNLFPNTTLNYIYDKYGKKWIVDNDNSDYKSNFRSSKCKEISNNVYRAKSGSTLYLLLKKVNIWSVIINERTWTFYPVEYKFEKPNLSDYFR